MRLINRQKYSECQLVAAFNAAIFLGTRERIGKYEYEYLVDLTGARFGSCISVGKSYPVLGIDYTDVEPTKESVVTYLSLGAPVQVNVWHEKTGFHTVLIVDYNKKKDKVKVVNFRHITNRKMWVSWDELNGRLALYKNLDPTKGNFRIFFKELGEIVYASQFPS